MAADPTEDRPVHRLIGELPASTRRDFVKHLGALGTALAALAALPGPMRELIGADALAAGGNQISAANLATYVATVEAVCSFDERTPPPATVRGRPQPSAADAGRRFAEDYSTEYTGFRQLVDLVLPIAEQGPRTPPPLGAVSAEDLVAYGGQPFSQLSIPLRLHFARSWLADHNPLPLDPGYAAVGIPDVGTLHRSIAVAAFQLTTFYYYADPRTWPSVGYTGPWLHRFHEREDLPYSHAKDYAYRIAMGDSTATWWRA